MGSEDERTGGTDGSDEIDSGSEGDARETASGGSDLTDKPAEEEAEVDTKKKKKKKDMGIGTSRGVETMFRTMYRVQQDLVSLADGKANMMITVNTLIIGVTVPVLAASTYELADGVGKNFLVFSIVVLLIGCVTALVFAVLAAVPVVSKDEITLEKIARNEGQILFFGHFVKLSEAEYTQGMRDLMESQDLLYMNMVRDLYALGRRLSEKFRLLRISYTVFILALVVGIGTFVLVFALDPNAIGR